MIGSIVGLCLLMWNMTYDIRWILFPVFIFTAAYSFCLYFQNRYIEFKKKDNEGAE